MGAMENLAFLLHEMGEREGALQLRQTDGWQFVPAMQRYLPVAAVPSGRAPVRKVFHGAAISEFDRALAQFEAVASRPRGNARTRVRAVGQDTLSGLPMRGNHRDRDTLR